MSDIHHQKLSSKGYPQFRSGIPILCGLFLLLAFFNTSFAQHSEMSGMEIAAFTGATVIEGTGAEPVENATLLIQGNEIICVGDCEIPSGATVHDARGKYIMPGLIDLHVHNALSGWIDSLPGIFGIDVSDKFPYEKTFNNLKKNQNPIQRSQLCSGVTTVFEPGGFPWGYQMQQATQHATNTPRYITAGPILTSLPTVINHPPGRKHVNLS